MISWKYWVKWYWSCAIELYTVQGDQWNARNMLQLKSMVIWGCSCTALQLVFEDPVLRLEKDQDWTGPRLIKTGNSQDHNCSPVFSPSPFLKFQGWAKTGLSGLNQSFGLSTNTFSQKLIRSFNTKLEEEKKNTIINIAYVTSQILKSTIPLCLSILKWSPKRSHQG